MMSVKNTGIRLPVQLYVALSLGAGIVLSPLTFSFVPLLFLALFLLFWFRPSWPLMALTFNLYLFLALPLIYEGIVATEVTPLIALPVLGLLHKDLQRLASTASHTDSSFKRQPSRILISLALVVAILITISVLVGKLNMLVTCALLAGYLTFNVVRLLAAMPPQPVTAVKAQYKIVAGHNISFSVPLNSRFRLGGWLSLTSSHEWIKLKPERIQLSQDAIELQVSLTPPLAGPSSISLTAYLLDRCGLIQTRFELELAELLVIPRAKYAAWLARRYLESTRGGTITPIASAMAAAPRSAGSRGGTEYYANRLYQPGDSLRTISWKHSVKLNELVVKEFISPQASSAALVVNQTVTDAAEADQLVYAWLLTSITLAREGIPTMLAVYSREGVKSVTGFLDSRQVVLRSLLLSRDIEFWDKPRRYLQPPDPSRIKADINKLKMVNTESLNSLIELLDMEYKALCDYASSNPATDAVSTALAKSRSRATLVFISAENHDVEALRMAKYRLKSRNLRFAEISINGNGAKADRGHAVCTNNYEF